MDKVTKNLHGYLNLHNWKRFDVSWWKSESTLFRYCEECGSLEQDHPYEPELIWVGYEGDARNDQSAIDAKTRLLTVARAKGIDTAQLEARWHIELSE